MEQPDFFFEYESNGYQYSREGLVDFNECVFKKCCKKYKKKNKSHCRNCPKK